MYARKKLLCAAATATLSLSLAAGAVGAQEGPPPHFVPPGHPSCHGQRISAIPRTYREPWNPHDRYLVLSDPTEPMYDPTVENAGDVNQRVKASCETD